MNWRDLFKPTLPKLILFILLFLILPVPTKICATCGVGCYWSLSFFWGLSVLQGTITGELFFINISSIIITLLLLVCLLLISYLLSCFIIFLYKRYKGNTIDR